MTFADYLQNQPLLRVAVAFVIGIVAGDGLTPAVEAWMWLAAAALAVAAFFIIGRRKPCLQSASAFAGIIFIGAALTTISERQLNFPFDDDEPVHYEAVLTDEPKVRGKTLQCDLALTAVNDSLLPKPINVKAAILRDTVTNDWRQLRAGSGIEAWSRMKPLANYREGGNFDYVKWLHARGFRAQTFIFYTDWQAKSVSLRPLSRYDRVRIKALRIRKNIVNRTSQMSDDGQRQAVVAAMVLGDKHALSRETKDVYSMTGASHVLALSGLHLGIIYAMLTLLFGRWRRGWLAQALTLVAVWAYVVVVGMGASVVRSAVMLTIYSLCLVARRDKAQVNTLAFAALCLLAANPLYLWDMGFQMSFLAVLAIAVYYRPLYHLLPLRSKAAKALWGMAVLSFSAQIGTAPLVAYYFGRFSCYFLLTNFIVVPAATAIIYGTVAMLLATPLPRLATILGNALGCVVGWLNGALSWMAALPGASVSGIRINTLQLYLIYIIIICVSVAAAYIGKAKGLEKLDAFK